VPSHHTGRGVRVPAVLPAIAVALLGAVAPARADNHQVRFEQVLAGANGDSRVQYIELKFQTSGQNQWGPQPFDFDFPESRSILTFHDATGLQTAEYAFPHDAPEGPADPDGGGHSVLVATERFEDATGLAADFAMPPLLVPGDGMVCLRGNPRNLLRFEVNLCLAYGDYAGPEEPDLCGNPNGPPAPPLPIAGPAPEALVRVRNDGIFQQFECFDSGPGNADFDLAPPTPRNSAGDTAGLAAASLAAQGEALFLLEPFGGNGRTCGSCHAAADRFAITPATVAGRFDADPGDPLFVAEHDPELATLENACLMRGGQERALFLENIDGFDRDPVFRASPDLLNVALTAPYGWSGEFADLRSFGEGAVRQHLPRTLGRNGDPFVGPLDFRLPTEFELAAMEAFMNGVAFPSDGDLDLDRMIDLAVSRGADAAAVQRGRDLFFGEAQCARCHGGPALADADGSLGTGTGNRAFATGVVNLLANADDGCAGGPGDPTAPLPAEAGGAREFSTPSLLGVANTAPYFHDNSVATLREAVAFYDSGQFALSPAGLLLAGLGHAVSLRPEAIDDVTAFLTAISIDPANPPPACSDGFDNDGDGDLDAAADAGCLDGLDRSEVYGDLDFDGDLDEADVDVFFTAFGLGPDDTGYLAEADLDGDGTVTFADYQLLLDALREPEPEPEPVARACGLLGAEPVLALLLARAVARRRRARR
jgi:cytochrome c peroxidase